MSVVADYRTDLAARIGDTGITAVTDPAKVKPPCVAVDVPSITAVHTARICTVTVDVAVFCVTNGPANDANLAALLDMAEALIPILRPTACEPAVLRVGSNDLPAYELTVTTTLTLDPGGS